MKIQIFDNETSNISSVIACIKRAKLSQIDVFREETFVDGVNALILPGVSSYDPYMEQVNRTNITDEISKNKDIVVMGICAGAQIMFQGSQEGNLAGIGIFPGMVEKIKQVEDYKIPHLGWNKLIMNENHPYVHIFDGIDLESEKFYFSHSYCMPDSKDVLAYTDYGYKIPAIVAKGTYFAVQFHPEKSYSQGMKLIGNILKHENT